MRREASFFEQERGSAAASLRARKKKALEGNLEIEVEKVNFEVDFGGKKRL